jgi:SAM-dependent methyltransferase
MIPYVLSDPEDFHRSNFAHWRSNTDMWLHASLRHISDVEPAMRALLQEQMRLLGDDCKVVDMGCGNAWLCASIRRVGLRGEYVGLDFNPDLVDWLAKNIQDARASFAVVDVESTLPTWLKETADVVVNAFNFMELPKLAEAFKNARAMLRSPGSLLVASIEPLSQLITLAADFEELKRSLTLYAKFGSGLAYDKQIETKHGPSSETYKGILYDFGDLQHSATLNGFTLHSFQRIITVNADKPEVYQLMSWRV